MSTFYSKVEEPFTGTGAGTNAGVTVTQAAPSEATDVYAVTGIQYDGDAAADVTVESPSGTVLWKKHYAAAYSENVEFEPGSLRGAVGQAVLLKISASTAFCNANIQGFRI